jgi:hypothetical protein
MTNERSENPARTCGRRHRRPKLIGLGRYGDSLPVFGLDSLVGGW